MKCVFRMAVVDPNDVSRASLKNLLLGIDMVWLEAECSRYEFFADVASQTNPDILLVSLDADPTAGLALVAQLSRDFPSASVLVVSTSQEGSLILQAMRNGAKEFLHFPINLEDFLVALDRVRQTIETQGGGEFRSSRIYTVAGVGGGVGCTSLAVNLACILAANEKNSVAVLDLDLALGDADVWLDIIPDYTIQDVAENITRLDYSLLKRSLTKHDSGTFLLPRPVQMEADTSIAPDELRRVISLLKATFTHLVMDISKDFGPLNLAALSVSDAVLLVSQLDLPCLRNVVRLVQFFDQIDGVSDKLKIVLNRVGLEETQISINKALETIGREIFWQIPNDYATMVESRNNGVPLIVQSPKSKLTRSIQQLAMVLEGTEEGPGSEDKTHKSRSGLFRFLGSGS